MTSNQNISSLDVIAFSDDVIYRLTQRDSRVAGLCARVETTSAETHTFERIGGELELTAKGRDQNTDDKAQDPTWDRRQVNIATFDMALFHEFDDLYKIIVNPQPFYKEKVVETVNKKKDAIVYAAAVGNASQITTAPDGTKVTSSVALPASQVINKDVGTADSGVNVDKLTEARGLNLVNENESRMTCIIDGESYKELLKDVKAVNGDYINGRPLTSGDLGELLGFDFTVYNRVDGAGTPADPKKVLLMDSEAVAVATGPEAVKMRADERKDKSYKWQLYVALTMAAVRLEEERVIVIESVTQSA